MSTPMAVVLVVAALVITWSLLVWFRLDRGVRRQIRDAWARGRRP